MLLFAWVQALATSPEQFQCSFSAVGLRSLISHWDLNGRFIFILVGFFTTNINDLSLVNWVDPASGWKSSGSHPSLSSSSARLMDPPQKNIIKSDSTAPPTIVPVPIHSPYLSRQVIRVSSDCGCWKHWGRGGWWRRGGGRGGVERQEETTAARLRSQRVTEGKKDGPHRRTLLIKIPPSFWYFHHSSTAALSLLHLHLLLLLLRLPLLRTQIPAASAAEAAAFPPPPSSSIFWVNAFLPLQIISTAWKKEKKKCRRRKGGGRRRNLAECKLYLSIHYKAYPLCLIRWRTGLSFLLFDLNTGWLSWLLSLWNNSFIRQPAPARNRDNFLREIFLFNYSCLYIPYIFWNASGNRPAILLLFFFFFFFFLLFLLLQLNNKKKKLAVGCALKPSNYQSARSLGLNARLLRLIYSEAWITIPSIN